MSRGRPTRRAIGLVADADDKSGTAVELIPADASLDELASIAGSGRPGELADAIAEALRRKAA